MMDAEPDRRFSPNQWPRVLSVTASLSPGGTELNALKTARLLVGEGAELRTFAISDEGPLAEQFSQVAPIEFWPIRGFGSRHHAAAIFAFHKALRRWSPEVVHAQDAYAAAFLLLFPWRIAARVVVNRRWQTTAKGWLDGLNRLAYRRFAAVAVNSEVLRSTVSAESGGRATVVLTRNVVEESCFAVPDVHHREYWRSQHGISGAAILIACVARLHPLKRHDLLIRAIALLRERTELDVHAVLVGDGSARLDLEKLTSDLDVARYVHFLGHVSDPRLVNYASDIACLCSDREGMPNSLVEAAATGLPIVASDVGGNPDIALVGSTGLLFSHGNVEELVQQLTLLSATPDLRNTLGRRARELAATHFTARGYRLQLLKLYGADIGQR